MRLASGAWQQVAVSLGWTALFCLAIALLLTLLDVSPTFLTNLWVSLCIGFSINIAFQLLEPWASARLPWYIAPVLITLSGLLVGLTIAGALIFQAPLFFLSEDYSSLVLGVFFGVFGLLFFSNRENLLRTRVQLSETEARSDRNARQLLETELRLLQAQIEPHFLFNTLSNIVSLIRTDPQGAEATLLNLSRLLRASLNRTRDSTTTLGEELEIIRAYLDIQKVRMGDRLTYCIDIPVALHRCPLPPLLVQPLVENAVIHGVEPSTEPGLVRISAMQADGSLTITVADYGVGLRAGNPGNGIGLRNVRDRLRGLYGHAARLELVAGDAGGLTAELTIPDTAP
ncbi:MAG: histidine kinase [Pseudomonadales bacterium]|nr:histidine kinase [Pseudomonadales bacterium]